ncbi:MAG: cellulose biosynthesis protein BcsG, partial [Succinivibrio sp.]
MASTYFIYKFILYFMAQISFSLPLNLIVLLLCFVKVNYGILKRFGGIFLFLFALYVLYHDSYLPSFSQAMVMSHGGFTEQLDFWSGYLVSVFEIKLLWILAGVFLICLFLHSNIHFGTVILMIFVYLLYVQVQGVLLTNSEYSKIDNTNTVSSPDIAPQLAKNPAKAESAEIENYVQAFLKAEKNRLVSFPQTLGENYQPFDVLIVNICSMATDDIIASNLLTHKLFSKFDFSFENFDSVSSYSTPASLRLLRMNCGQQSESAIYSGRRSECELISSLEVLGFQSQVYFDHNGVYGSYLKYLHELAGLSDSIYPLSNLRVKYQSFDGSPIYSDRDLFEAYANRIEKNSVP